MLKIEYINEKGDSAMENAKVLRNTGGVLSVSGAIISGVGLYLRQQANSMVSALRSGAGLFGYNSSTYRSLDIWEGKQTQGNIILAIGIVVLIVGVIVFYKGFLKGNGAKHPEKQEITPSKSVAYRINELKEAKESGIISEDEYEQKRKEILSEI